MKKKSAQGNLPVIKTISFSESGTEYPLDIIDANGNRWATFTQVGEALGIGNIRDLVAELTKKDELKVGKHFCRITRQKSGRANPNLLVLSYRGIIRVSMRSDGSRAKQFRDWAEDVLFEVMTTGVYALPDTELKPAIEPSPPLPPKLHNLKGPLHFFDDDFKGETIHGKIVDPANRPKSGHVAIRAHTWAALAGDPEYLKGFKRLPVEILERLLPLVGKTCAGGRKRISLHVVASPLCSVFNSMAQLKEGS